MPQIHRTKGRTSHDAPRPYDNVDKPVKRSSSHKQKRQPNDYTLKTSRRKSDVFDTQPASKRSLFGGFFERKSAPAPRHTERRKSSAGEYTRDSHKYADPPRGKHKHRHRSTNEQPVLKPEYVYPKAKKRSHRHSIDASAIRPEPRRHRDEEKREKSSKSAWLRTLGFGLAAEYVRQRDKQDRANRNSYSAPTPKYDFRPREKTRTREPEPSKKTRTREPEPSKKRRSFEPASSTMPRSYEAAPNQPRRSYEPAPNPQTHSYIYRTNAKAQAFDSQPLPKSRSYGYPPSTKTQTYAYPINTTTTPSYDNPPSTKARSSSFREKERPAAVPDTKHKSRASYGGTREASAPIFSENKSLASEMETKSARRQSFGAQSVRPNSMTSAAYGAYSSGARPVSSSAAASTPITPAYKVKPNAAPFTTRVDQPSASQVKQRRPSVLPVRPARVPFPDVDVAEFTEDSDISGAVRAFNVEQPPPLGRMREETWIPFTAKEFDSHRPAHARAHTYKAARPSLHGNSLRTDTVGNVFRTDPRRRKHVVIDMDPSEDSSGNSSLAVFDGEASRNYYRLPEAPDVTRERARKVAPKIAKDTRWSVAAAKNAVEDAINPFPRDEDE